MGGGGGSAGRVAQEQARQDSNRQAAVSSGIARTNAMYDSPERQGQYNDFLSAQRQMFFDELGRQQKEANRNNTFDLARRGLVGSRVAIDRGRDLGESYNRGVVNADRHAQGALSDLMSADDQSRRDTIQLIQSGADVTSASNLAARGLRSNLSGAKTAANADALGSVFGSFGDMYKRSLERDAERRALRDRAMLYNTTNTFGYGNGGP